MRIGNRLFPYPILNNDKLFSQYKTSTFSLLYDETISEDRQNYLLEGIHCELDNPFLQELVEKGKAEICCIIECPSTMYRRKYRISKNPIDICIPVTDLNDKVDISAFIIAKEDIDNYISDDFLDDYSGIVFSIEKHDILAADDGYTNNVDFHEDDDLKSSIFIVIKDNGISDNTMRIEYDSTRITIFLPEEQWNKYDKTKRISQFESLYFSIIAIPALSYALSSLQKNDPMVDTLRSEYRWFNSFCEAYKKFHGAELDDEAFAKIDTNLEAQKILDCPVTKAIDEIFGLTINSNSGEECDD